MTSSDDNAPDLLIVESTGRGWYAGEGGLGARGVTRDEAIARLRAVQALVKRLAAPWYAARCQPYRREDDR